MYSENLNELATALSKAQAEFPAIGKDATNPFFKSKYADLATVVKTASPILTKYGLSISQFPGHNEAGDTLTTWLLHSSGQYIRETMQLHLNKQDAQGQGSAMTYARRYSYMGILGLVADEDDDGNAASPKIEAYKTPLEKQVTEKIEKKIEVSPITADQVTKLLHAAKMKGFATKESATEAVNALSEQIFSKPFDKLNMDEATLLNKNLNEVKTTKESIELLLSDIPF